MKKTYYVVDSTSQQICYKKVVNPIWYADEQPLMRRGGLAMRIGCDCALGGLALGFINRLIPFLHGRFVKYIAMGTALLTLALWAYGAVCIKLAEKEKKGVDPKRKPKHKLRLINGVWSDPYHLLSQHSCGTNPSKKLYYIVDSEKNAIVDVKRLGKWGQAYVERRRKKQQT